MLRLFPLVIAALAGCAALFQAAAAEESTDEPREFARAIATAQARTVKVYGAGIGREAAYGSGLIVSRQGEILTALGVYLRGERLRVVLPDGAVHHAVVQRRSDPLQLALLKIETTTPDYFEVDPQPAAKVGDFVIAVSNAFRVAEGSEPLSATLGVVSLRKQLDFRRGVQDLPHQGEVLLLDAITSNSGAPGGAVVTVEGKLAGMIGRLVEDRNTLIRLNYAVPNDVLRAFLDGKSGDRETPPVASVKHEKVELGLRLFGLTGKTGPAYVDRVAAGSPAAAAGLKTDDLILSVAGQAVKSVQEFETLAAQLKPSQSVQLVVKRKSETLTLTLTPVASKEP